MTQTRKMFSNSMLKRMILPLLVEQLLVMLVGMIDSVMVSSAGEAALSGVTIVNDVNNLAIQLLAALAGGGAVIVAQYVGHHETESSNLAAGQLVLLSFVVSMITGLCCFLFHAQILNLFYSSVEYDVMEAAKTYFWITALSFPFLGVYNAGASIYRAMGQTKTTMYVSILMNTINVVGNTLGMYVFHMGVAGVAWPTLISRIVAAVVMIYLTFDPHNVVCVKWENILHWNSAIQRKIVSIALPNAVENGLFMFGKILVSSIVSTFGTMEIAANGAANSLMSIAYTTENAMQLGIVTVVGQCVGANDYDQAKYYTKKMVRIAWILAALSNILMWLASPLTLQIFSLSSETMSITETIVMMECFAIAILHAPSFVLPCALRASGDAKFTMYVGVISMFAARVGCAYLLGNILGLGVVGTRMAMYIDWIVRIIFFTYRYVSGKWMNYRVVE